MAGSQIATEVVGRQMLHEISKGFVKNGPFPLDSLESAGIRSDFVKNLLAGASNREESARWSIKDRAVKVAFLLRVNVILLFIMFFSRGDLDCQMDVLS